MQKAPKTAIIFSLFLLVGFSLSAQEFGIWSVLDDKDQFGDPNGKKFIITKTAIAGRFTSDLVANQGLSAFIAYSKDQGPLFELKEFGRTPLVGFGNETINVVFQDKNKKQYTARGMISSGIIFIDPEGRSAVIAALSLGGVVKFRIRITSPVDTSNYSFDIENADGFAAAFSQL
jgi:hypothetical protein